jgi:hypothetical protein
VIWWWVGFYLRTGLIISGIIISVIFDIVVLYIVTVVGLLPIISNVGDNIAGIILLIIAIVNGVLWGYIGYRISISASQSKLFLYANYMVAIVILVAMFAGYDSIGV